MVGGERRWTHVDLIDQFLAGGGGKVGTHVDLTDQFLAGRRRKGGHMLT